MGYEIEMDEGTAKFMPENGSCGGEIHKKKDLKAYFDKLKEIHKK